MKHYTLAGFQHKFWYAIVIPQKVIVDHLIKEIHVSSLLLYVDHNLPRAYNLIHAVLGSIFLGSLIFFL